MKKLLLLLALLFAAPLVSAYVDVTYHYDQQHVDIQGYTCLNADCSSVSQSPFGFNAHTDNGKYTVIFPSTLQSPYGYALFHTTPEYVPMETAANWHTYGNNGHVYVNRTVNFYQINNCKSLITEFNVTNDIHPNQPIMINVSSSLDATTYSAFFLVNNSIDYIPASLKDVYYSADTSVRLEIRNGSGVPVYNDVRYFTATNGNPIFADDSMDVQFAWTPVARDNYTATVIADVIDPQCSNSIPTSASKKFLVQDEIMDECYTIMNSLAPSEPYPTVGETVTFSYTKISNHADSGIVLTPVPTSAQYTITNNQTGIVVAQSSSVLAANGNSVNPSTHTFAWTPSTAGWYVVRIDGVAQSQLCSGVENPTESLAQLIYISPVPMYAVTFQIYDSVSGNPIEGASLAFNAQNGTTNSNGSITFHDIASGSYPYTASKPGYNSASGSVTVTNADQTVSIVLVPIQNQPYQCSDGADNDQDGYVDMADPGCSSLTDDDETNAVSLYQCSDGIDNDYDSLIDLADPGCSGPTDNDESNGGNNQTIACYNAADCPQPSPVPAYCSGLNYTVSMPSAVCTNPGTAQSSCGIANNIVSEQCNSICSPVFGCDFTQCSDSADNDGDGYTDMADPGCTDPYDNDESNPVTSYQCSDSIDNDGDGFIDLADPGCSGPTDNNESDGPISCNTNADCAVPAVVQQFCSGMNFTQQTAVGVCMNPGTEQSSCGITYITISSEQCTNICSSTFGCDFTQCSDGADNDADGATDYSTDFSCSSFLDNDETYPFSQCQDGIDNDGDGITDLADPDCTSSQDNSEDNFTPGYTQCSDGADNDADGLIDMADPGCSAPSDKDESDGTSQCQDGIDNDGDGSIDYPDDFGCSSPQDDDEGDASAACQDGIDNDGDGYTDLDDEGCTSSQDDDEYNNYAPYFISTPVREAFPGFIYEYDADAKDPNGDILTYSLLTGPAGMVINPTTGMISWDVPSSFRGTVTVTVRASDGSLHADQTYTLSKDMPDSEKYPRQKLYIDSIRMNNEVYELVKPGDDLLFDTIFENTGVYDGDRYFIRVTVVELGISRKIGPFTGPDVSEESRNLALLTVPRDAAQGVYTARIAIVDTDGNIKRVRHRDFRVI